MDKDILRDDIISLKKLKTNRKHDLIYCAHAIMYIPYSYDLVMFRRWRELLKPGGKLIIEESLDKEYWEYMKFIREPKYLIERLTDAGFENIKVRDFPEWSRHSGGYCVECEK